MLFILDLIKPYLLPYVIATNHTFWNRWRKRGEIEKQVKWHKYWQTSRWIDSSGLGINWLIDLGVGLINWNQFSEATEKRQRWHFVTETFVRKFIHPCWWEVSVTSTTGQRCLNFWKHMSRCCSFSDSICTDDLDSRLYGNVSVQCKFFRTHCLIFHTLAR